MRIKLLYCWVKAPPAGRALRGLSLSGAGGGDDIGRAGLPQGTCGHPASCPGRTGHTAYDHDHTGDREHNKQHYPGYGHAHYQANKVVNWRGEGGGEGKGANRSNLGSAIQFLVGNFVLATQDVYSEISNKKYSRKRANLLTKDKPIVLLYTHIRKKITSERGQLLYKGQNSWSRKCPYQEFPL